MINYKRLSITILIGALLVYGLRYYTYAWAVNSTIFGCKEAAFKEYLHFSVEDGNKLQKFCEARQKMYEEEFKW